MTFQKRLQQWGKVVRATDFDFSDNGAFQQWQLKYAQQLADDLGSVADALSVARDPERYRATAQFLERQARIIQSHADQLKRLADEVK